MRTVRTYSIPSEAHVSQAALESAGIPTVIRNDLTVQTNWLYSNAVGGISIEVPDENYDDAMTILGFPKSNEGLIQCPRCMSSDVFIRPMSAFTAVCLALKIPFPEVISTFDCRSCKTTHTCRRDGAKSQSK